MRNKLQYGQGHVLCDEERRTDRDGQRVEKRGAWLCQCAAESGTRLENVLLGAYQWFAARSHRVAVRGERRAERALASRRRQVCRELLRERSSPRELVDWHEQRKPRPGEQSNRAEQCQQQQQQRDEQRVEVDILGERKRVSRRGSKASGVLNIVHKEEDTQAESRAERWKGRLRVAAHTAFSTECKRRRRHRLYA